MPKLTPSTSENDAEVWRHPEASVAESVDSKVSKRSVSPTKRTVDLRVADERVIQKSIRSRADVPGDVQELLYKKIQGVATFSQSIIPKGIEVRTPFNLGRPISHSF
jgi:hypothetical protein